ncbi:hypothetical protein DSOL_4898 [Desulfosporosinus metallidurans]|uniref:Uncharacterized protein n=1 Tax=Desulfosporosinus metallidurans TaxID=1888891 RepID=A0A1Q8QH03_9FIRM|nr:hypothetical protein DSOL_4898 [Desulfosporosinus metallidurans]
MPWEREGTSGLNKYVVTDEVLDFIMELLDRAMGSAAMWTTLRLAASG